MANPPPMLPGLGFPVDSKIDLLRKWTWNTWLWAQEDFQPEDIPGLGLDLDASYGVLNSISPDVPATNGQSVRRWLDKSGNGRHYDQSIATNQPLFSLAGLNGRPCLVSDGLNDAMAQIAGLNLLQAVPGCTIIAVHEGASSILSAPDQVFTAKVDGANGIRAGIGRFNPNAFRAAGRRLNTDSVQDTLYTPLTTNAVIHVGLFAYASAKLFQYLNGALVSTLDPFQTAGSTSNGPSSSIEVMSYNGTYFYAGKIARILVWPRALTAPELAQVHAYLSQTYGISLA